MRRSEEDFSLRGPDDFVRLDSRCLELLRAFFQWLQSEGGGGLSEGDASGLAHAADRYVRDFLVDIVESGPLDPAEGRVRQYLGNWYIVNTLSPSHEEIDKILRALTLWYRFLVAEGLLPPAVGEAFRGTLSAASLYHRRLEDFWELTPEAIPAWREVDDYRRSRSTPLESRH